MSWNSPNSYTGSEALVLKDILNGIGNDLRVQGGNHDGGGYYNANWHDRGGIVFDVKAYGAVGDGSTDDTTAVNAAISAASALGGIVYFPPATYRCNGQLAIPNTGSGVPNQKGLIFQGAGCFFSGQGRSPNGGSILDLRYSGTGGKILTRGDGALALRDITLADYSTGNTTPFLYVTNTTVFCERVGFYGSVSGSTTTQDAIVLGGTSTTRDGTNSAPFGGYGASFRDCYWNKVRRAVYGRAYCNGVQIINPTIWSGGGGAAALEFDGDGGAGQLCDGGQIIGGIIELPGYTAGVKLTRATHFTLIGVNVYDYDGSSTYGILIGANSLYNTVIDGTWTSGGPPYYTDQNSGTLNTRISGDVNELTRLLQVKIINELQGIVPVTVNDAQTGLLATTGQVGISKKQKNSTVNNWLVDMYVAQGGAAAGSAGMQFLSHSSGYGRYVIATRGATNFGERLSLGDAGVVSLTDLPVYADRTAATGAGLAAGRLYRTSAGAVMQV